MGVRPVRRSRAAGSAGTLFSAAHATIQAPQPVQRSRSITMPYRRVFICGHIFYGRRSRRFGFLVQLAGQRRQHAERSRRRSSRGGPRNRGDGGPFAEFAAELAECVAGSSIQTAPASSSSCSFAADSMDRRASPVRAPGLVQVAGAAAEQCFAARIDGVRDGATATDPARKAAALVAPCDGGASSGERA